MDVTEGVESDCVRDGDKNDVIVTDGDKVDVKVATKKREDIEERVGVGVGVCV